MLVVTGGAGFIGSGLIRVLNEQGYRQIIIVDDLGRTEKWKNLVGKKFADIIHPQAFFDWLKTTKPNIQAIFHLGACTDTTESDASYLLENNTRYSMKLAEYALSHQIQFIYASSAATYGDGSRGFVDDHERLEELQPLNMYGYSKHLFDLWLKNQNVLDQVVGLKYFNVFGPNEGHKGKMASAIFHVLGSAKNQQLIKLFKSSEPHLYRDGEQKRDFIYVKDAAKMTAAFLNSPARGIFNIGKGHPDTWKDLAEAVFESLSIQGQIQYIDMPKELIGKYQNYTCADMKKTKAALQEASTCYSIQESVKDYVQNHLLIDQTW